MKLHKIVPQLIVFLVLIIFVAPSTAHANTQNFTIASFDATYTLGKDDNNRSILSVEETITAQFPNYDQNHGIERAIPNTYDGHSVSLSIDSVDKPNGGNWSYTTYQSNGNTVLRIGDANRYLQGEQIFIINYMLRDVTKNFSGGDEFFWDINGTDWQQTIERVQATVYLEDSIKAAFDNRLQCYSGVAGSTASDCTISASIDGVITATSTQPLAAQENLSIVVGFAPNTFSGYVAPPIPLWLKLFWFVVVPIGYVIFPILVLLWAVRTWRSKGRDVTKQTTIVPQYIPPKNTSMLLNDTIINTKMRPKAVSASIIDLAVRHYLKIYEVKKKEYELEINKPIDGTHPDDVSVLQLLFGNSLQVGSRIALKDKKTIYKQVEQLGKETYQAAIASGYMADTRAVQKKVYIVGGIFTFISIVTLNPLLFVAAITTLVLGAYMPARTAKGIELKSYLDGTKMYMQVAEAERLKVLQSADSAIKVNTRSADQLVKLYERLLPLAMLYGIEKSWATQFAHLYTPETQPDWYVGNYSTFNAAVFAGSLASFGSSSVSSFSPPSNSSSSGFSGGGSSGGGGGGGGGGGW